MVTEPTTIRRVYLDALQDYLDRMRDGCRQFGVDYRCVPISHDYEQVLGDFMLARAGRQVLA